MVSELAKLKPSMRNGSMPRDALRAVGDVDRARQVVEEDAHDLAEAERDDGKVVAAQLERRRAEQHAEQRGDRRADRQDDPERQVQIEVRAGEQRIGVGADGVERDVAEIEQAGEADDDVQAEREQHVEDGVVGDAHPAGADLRQRERQHGERSPATSTMPTQRTALACRAPVLHARSPTRSPSRPERPEHQHQDQHDEREHVLVVRAEQDEVAAAVAIADAWPPGFRRRTGR